MSLRTKLLLAQAPLGLAICFLGLVGVWSSTSLGTQAQSILKDNYRSVLAAQRMKESIERLDSAALFIPSGRRSQAEKLIREHRALFEHELQVQESNITEEGEVDATKLLRERWTDYLQRYDKYLALNDVAAQRDYYFDNLQPQFTAVKDAADGILAINQDAMVHKSDMARKEATAANATMVASAIGALIVGAIVSVSITNRLLRPLAVLTQAVARLGQGDFQARAMVDRPDEIGQLASRFNTMAEHLNEYRSSSLGELLLAQRASQAAIDSIPDPVIVFTADGGLLTINAEAQAVLGETSDAVGGGTALTTVEPRLRAALAAAQQHVLQGKGQFVPKGFEDALAITVGGAERWFLLRASPVYEEQGRIAGATVILQNVTRLRRFDELKNDLVATVAHEFRTPLTSLRMAIHLCLEGIAGPLTEKQLDLLQAGREDCERLQATVDELLDLARIQSGRIELKRQPLSTIDMVKSAVAAARTAADEKGIHLKTSLLVTATEVEADPERTALIFSNLIGNAIRHTPRGGIVELKAADVDGQVRFEVSDTGSGIPKEHQAHVFEKFYRVPGNPSGGAGLGLSLVKEIVEAHSGELGLESQPGSGSTFWFTLPAARRVAALLVR